MLYGAGVVIVLCVVYIVHLLGVAKYRKQVLSFLDGEIKYQNDSITQLRRSNELRLHALEECINDLEERNRKDRRRLEQIERFLVGENRIEDVLKQLNYSKFKTGLVGALWPENGRPEPSTVEFLRSLSTVGDLLLDVHQLKELLFGEEYDKSRRLWALHGNLTGILQALGDTIMRNSIIRIGEEIRVSKQGERSSGL